MMDRARHGGGPGGWALAMDGRMLDGATTGVGSYARELRIAQRSLDDGASVLTAGQTHDGRLRRWLGSAWPGARGCRLGTSERLIARDIFRRAQVHFDLYRRPLRLRAPGPAGIMHWTYPVPLLIDGWRNLYTVHDAIPLTHPSLTGIDAGRHRRLLAAIARDAAGIVTVSASAREEIAAALGWPADAVHDCGEAVAPEPPTAPLPAGLVPGGYVLAVGTVEKRKNLPALIAAHRAAALTLPLVIAGPDGDDADRVARLAGPGLVRLPYLAEPVLRSVIANARAMAMVSLAEGFGLPVIEAMALGTPVIASDRGALAEVAGGAALLVDPLSEDGITAALVAFAGDDALCRRHIAAGRANAARFSRRTFAARLAALYAGLS